MLSEFRARDAPRLLELRRENFPEEEAIYGTRPDAFVEVVAGVYRWDRRLLLRLAAALGRPVFRLLTIEADGRLVATTLLSFGREAVFLSMVMVDRPYRRRGYARQLLRAAIEEARRFGRPYVALDVLGTNEPARRLYESEGFRLLRPLALMLWLPAEDAPAARSIANARIRPMRRSDVDALVALRRAANPPEVEEVLPTLPSSVAPPRGVDRVLESRSRAWVLEDRGAPVAHVQATVSSASEAGYLSSPILAPGLPAEEGAELVRAALAWLVAEGRPRVVCQVARPAGIGSKALEEGGFRVAHEFQTLYRSSD